MIMPREIAGVGDAKSAIEPAAPGFGEILSEAITQTNQNITAASGAAENSPQVAATISTARCSH